MLATLEIHNLFNRSMPPTKILFENNVLNRMLVLGKLSKAVFDTYEVLGKTTYNDNVEPYDIVVSAGDTQILGIYIDDTPAEPDEGLVGA